MQRFGVPPIAGFLVAGFLAGPGGFGLIHDPHEVEVLAEIGVILLLFGIGLELSFERLQRLWRPILLTGTMQILGTIAGTYGAARLMGLEWRPALFFGFLVSVSSTAIVLKGLERRGELDAPHGRLTLGILVFQDLSVVPMMLAIPLLAGTDTSPSLLLRQLLVAALLVTFVVLAARLLVPRLLDFVAATRQRDLFILGVCLVCIGTAWAATWAGVSIALGAFLGGLIVAGSGYRHQALADLIPLRDVFSSLFFVSVGMLFAPEHFMQRGIPILGLFSAIVVGKFLVVFAAGSVLRLPLRVSVLAGTALAQVGEFSFVLSRAAASSSLLPAPFAEDLLAASILSMLATPILLALGPHLAAGATRLRPLAQLLDVRSPEDVFEGESAPAGHVLIAGYGLAGQELARALRESNVPHLVVDLNPSRVRQAAGDGSRSCYGDVASTEVLQKLHADSAKELVLLVNDPDAIDRTLRAARSVAPRLHVAVRSRYLADVKSLLRAGANEVVPSEVEAAVQLTKRVLRRHGVEAHVVRAQVMRIRQRQDAAGE